MSQITHNYASPEKIISRTVMINKFIEKTGLTVLPEDQNMISLGGLCIRNKKLIIGSEFDHLCNGLKFLKPKQYYSIEREKAIHLENSIIPKAHYIYGDFVDRLYSNEMPENIGLINFDVCKTPRIAKDNLENIIRYVNGTNKSKLLLACNVVIRHHLNNMSANDSETLLLDSLYLDDTWSYEGRYEYDPHSSNTLMCCFFFWKK